MAFGGPAAPCLGQPFNVQTCGFVGRCSLSGLFGRVDGRSQVEIQPHYDIKKAENTWAQRSRDTLRRKRRWTVHQNFWQATRFHFDSIPRFFKLQTGAERWPVLTPFGAFLKLYSLKKQKKNQKDTQKTQLREIRGVNFVSSHSQSQTRQHLGVQLS